MRLLDRIQNGKLRKICEVEEKRMALALAQDGWLDHGEKIMLATIRSQGKSLKRIDRSRMLIDHVWEKRLYCNAPFGKILNLVENGILLPTIFRFGNLKEFKRKTACAMVFCYLKLIKNDLTRCWFVYCGKTA